MSHPIPRFAHALDDALDKVLTASTIGLDAAASSDALLTLARVKARLAALEMKVLAASSAVCDDGAHRSVADYLAAVSHADRGPLAAAEHLAHELDTRWHHLASALADGTVPLDKVRVIATALTTLSTDPLVSAEVLEKAETHLISISPDFTARQLTSLARRVLEVVAPAIGETAEATALAAEEHRAQQAMRLSFRACPEVPGTTEIHARVPDAIATRLKTYLEAFTNPRRTDADLAPSDRLPHPRRLAEAFCSLIEAVDPTRLPIHGGTATTVMVTISLESLRAQLSAGDLTGSSDHDLRITAAQARRLACTADLIPAVLGTNSEVLDLGRTSRLFTPAQRKAMALRDKRCRADGCTQPANWCEAHHHRQPWSQGGRTDLADGKLLCRWHHHRAHDHRYQTSELPNGDVRFTRRR